MATRPRRGRWKPMTPHESVLTQAQRYLRVAAAVCAGRLTRLAGIET